MPAMTASGGRMPLLIKNGLMVAQGWREGVVRDTDQDVRTYTQRAWQVV